MKSLAYKSADVCQRYRWLIVLAWAIACVPGLIYGRRLLGATTTLTKAVEGIPSYDAMATYRAHFPDSGKQLLEIIYVTTNDGASVVEQPLRAKLEMFCGLLQTALSNEFPGLHITTQSYLTIESWVPKLVRVLVAQDKSAFGIKLNYDPPANHKDGRVFVDAVHNIGDALLVTLGLGDKVSMSMSGWTAGVTDVVEGVNNDLHNVHVYAVPIVLCILAYVVGSLSLVLIPCIALPVALICQSSIMYPVALKLIVSSFTPIMTMALTTAISVDYTLFMLSSFMAGLKRGLTFDSAVHQMVASAGYTVLVSGSTLCVSFLALLMLRSPTSKCLGISLCTAAFLCMLVNLSLVPAMLFAVGERLLKVDNVLARLLVCRRKKRDGADGLKGITEIGEETKEAKADTADAPSSPPPTKALPHGDAYYDYTMEPGVWLWLARLITSPKRRWISWVALAAVVALAMPVIVQVGDLNPSLTLTNFLPYQSRQYKALEDVGRYFKGDLGNPAQILMVADPSKLPEGLISPKGWESMTTVMKTLLRDAQPLSADSIVSLVAFGGDFIPYETMVQARDFAAQGAPGSDVFSLRILTSGDTSQLSPDGLATLSVIIPSVTMFSPEGQRWMDLVRSVLAGLEETVPLKLALVADAAITHDTINMLNVSFPITLAVTLVLVFALLGLFLRSVVAPLRSVVSILLTLTFTYGAAVMVYQQGVLNWTGIRAISSSGGICWNNVFECCSIIVGLALDYDVFLVTSVLEFRMAGYSDKDALVRAMSFTGRIITAAGMIIFAAFSGLLVSNVMMLNQFGFVVCVAVLLDTFVVRALVVPVLIDMTGRYTWWPRRLPEVKELPETAVTSPDKAAAAIAQQ